MSRRTWSLFLPLLLVLLAGAVPAAHAQAPAPATASNLTTSTFGPLYEAAGSVIQLSTGCTASLDCPDGTEISCTGQQSCLVGSNYVECDGDRWPYCPGTCGTASCVKDFQCWDFCGDTFAFCAATGCCIC